MSCQDFHVEFMFQRKRIEVKVGDVFVERVRQTRRISRLLGLHRKSGNLITGNSWLVTQLIHMDGLPHAQLQLSQNVDGATVTRLIALGTLEAEENYQRIAPA